MRLPLGQYLFAWQLLIMVLFVIGWLVGGTFLLLASLRRRDPKTRIPTSRCFNVTLLTGLAGGVGGAVLFSLLYAIGSRADSNFFIPGAIFGALAALAIAFLVVSTMLNLPTGDTFKVASLPVGAIALWGLVLFIPTAIFSYIHTQALARQEVCTRTLLHLSNPILIYLNTFGELPENLQELLDEKITRPVDLCCPVAERDEIGYFFKPSALSKDIKTRKILACDFRRNHKGEGRSVMYVTLHCEWVYEQAFKKLLSLEENADFAEALAEAEGRR